MDKFTSMTITPVISRPSTSTEPTSPLPPRALSVRIEQSPTTTRLRIRNGTLTISNNAVTVRPITSSSAHPAVDPEPMVPLTYCNAMAHLFTNFVSIWGNLCGIQERLQIPVDIPLLLEEELRDEISRREFRLLASAHIMIMNSRRRWKACINTISGGGKDSASGLNDGGNGEVLEKCKLGMERFGEGIEEKIREIEELLWSPRKGRLVDGSSRLIQSFEDAGEEAARTLTGGESWYSCWEPSEKKVDKLLPALTFIEMGGRVGIRVMKAQLRVEGGELEEVEVDDEEGEKGLDGDIVFSFKRT